MVAGSPFPLEEERINMSVLADLLSMGLQNATLLDPTRDGTWVDPLTGVSNRIYFLQRFENAIRRTENYRQTLALFMLDIDEFKKVNDTHGHYAGDVGGEWKQSINDVRGRGTIRQACHLSSGPMRPLNS